MEGLRSTEQSTLTLATVSAQSLPQGNSHQKRHIYKLGGVGFFLLAKQTSQSGSKQLLRKCVSVLAGCLSAIWKCHRTITNNHPLRLPEHQQRAYLHKDIEKQTLRPNKPDTWSLNAP